ncbi:LysR family transcriptional regulator [Actinokineospora sp. NBRC 105648]|uniref:LysR family transcriptional regulator n=1 Tax=Actinokineospora sp. NBRC 105648 TaxID=3032206 RepID=UPI0024A35A2E|nr:LysR family transcriptional regulator [Actinokineospora sp. NBRC 105648]GLZ38895.1 LysR family transcriptional regulator [Actinokineospora sp. NBRC 105648]
MDLEIRHLRAICAIAEAGSLSQAATALGVSQPSLTLLLQRVERSVGGQLFQRSRAGTAPTPLGERVLRRARLLLTELDAFGADLAHVGGDHAIRVGTVHMECVGTLVERLDAGLPEAEITLQVEPSSTMLAHSLAHGRLDAAVLGMSDEQDVPQARNVVHRTLVPKVPVFVAISADHRLAHADEVDLADLAEEAWICPPGADDGSLTALRAACRKAGFLPRVRFEAPSGGGRQLIAGGQAVQLVEPTSMGGPGLAIKPLTGEPMLIRLVLAWRRDRLGEDEVDRTYRAAAGAYTEHALLSPTFRDWWRDHPEVHPRLG